MGKLSPAYGEQRNLQESRQCNLSPPAAMGQKKTSAQRTPMDQGEILPSPRPPKVGLHRASRRQKGRKYDGPPPKGRTNAHQTAPSYPGRSQSIRSSLGSLFRRTHGCEMAGTLAQTEETHCFMERAGRPVPGLQPEDYKGKRMASVSPASSCLWRN